MIEFVNIVRRRKIIENDFPGLRFHIKPGMMTTIVLVDTQIKGTKENDRKVWHKLSLLDWQM